MSDCDLTLMEILSIEPVIVHCRDCGWGGREDELVGYHNLCHDCGSNKIEEGMPDWENIKKGKNGETIITTGELGIKKWEYNFD